MKKSPNERCEYACTTTLDHPTPGYCGDASDGKQPPRCPGHRAMESTAPTMFPSMPLRAIITLAVVAVVGHCAAGCGASAETRARYSVEGARCVADIQEIVRREGTTEEEDLEDLAELREDCREELARIEGAQ